MIPSFTTPDINRRILLVRRPQGIPLAGDFRTEVAPVPSVEADTLLVRNLYLSADPVQRGWAANEAAMPLGSVMQSLAVAIVLESRMAGIAPGDLVHGRFGWQDYAIAKRADILSHVARPRAPASAYAGVLGMPGVTAWLALADYAPPKPDETILVSTAAGAVGSVVSQIARAAGARVIGLTGSEIKVARCVERYGCAEAYNYKEVDLAGALKQAAPDGYSTYFDNTGGWILDTALRAMAKGGRIIQCGTAATASWFPPPTGLRPEREILTRVLTWSGFYIFDHQERFGAAIEALSDLMDAGQLHHDEDLEIGFARVAGTLETLFAGENMGKKLIFIGDD